MSPAVPRIATILSVVSGAGCNPPPALPIEYETAHLRIGTDFGHPLCEGDLQDFERSVAFIEDDLGLELPERIDLYLWSADGWDSQGAGECNFPDYVFGCYSYDDSTIHATKYSFEHELTHAIVDNPNLDVFFSEGIANAYSERVLPFGETAPTANANVSHNDFDPRTASHFTRWLRERWGGYKLGQLATSKGTGFDSFKTIYGMTMAQAEILYFVEASSIYAPLQSCDSLEMSRLNFANGWGSEIELDCDSDDTHAGSTGLYSRRTLVVSEEGKYSFATDGAWVTAYRCAEGPIGDYIHDENLETEDIPPEYSGYPSPSARHFEGGVVHTVELPAGRYNFTIGIDGHEPGTVSISVWASLSPGPVEPEG